MSNDTNQVKPETKMIDMLFLELAQFTTAKTKRALELESALADEQMKNKELRGLLHRMFSGKGTKADQDALNQVLAEEKAKAEAEQAQQAPGCAPLADGGKGSALVTNDKGPVTSDRTEEDGGRSAAAPGG